MTIGIGVLASEKTKPDTAILVADTLGSFDDEYSMNRLHKIFTFPNVDLYATVADRVDLAAVALPVMAKEIAGIPDGQRSYGEIARRLTRAILHYKTELFGMSMLPRIWNHPEDLKSGRIPDSVRQLINEEWERFPLGFQLVVATFDDHGQAFLFLVDDQWLQNLSFPGFAAIGTGCMNAMFWLSYRNHNLGLSAKHAAYHALEAKLMSEKSPHVNDKTDLLVARKGYHNMQTDFRPPTKDAPFTLAELREMLAIYLPKATDELTATSSEGTSPNVDGSGARNFGSPVA